MVELLRRYSNWGDLLDDLNRVVARLDGCSAEPADEDEPDDLASACQHNPRERLLSERLTANDVTKMLELYWSGTNTIQEIATEFQVGKTALKRLFREHGGRPTDERFTPEAIAALLERYRAGGTIRGLAAEFGIGTTTLKRWIRERGVGRKSQ
jgi:transposase-like protein